MNNIPFIDRKCAFRHECLTKKCPYRETYDEDELLGMQEEELCCDERSQDTGKDDKILSAINKAWDEQHKICIEMNKTAEKSTLTQLFELYCEGVGIDSTDENDPFVKEMRDMCNGNVSTIAKEMGMTEIHNTLNRLQAARRDKFVIDSFPFLTPSFTEDENITLPDHIGGEGHNIPTSIIGAVGAGRVNMNRIMELCRNMTNPDVVVTPGEMAKSITTNQLHNSVVYFDELELWRKDDDVIADKENASDKPWNRKDRREQKYKTRKKGKKSKMRRK